MREIKFRGLTTGKAPKFIYGCLLNNLWTYNGNSKYPKGTSVTQIVITGEADDWQAVEDNELVVDVTPESVGQYTGLKDKNGKEIYEGDILEIKTQSGMVEKFIVEWGIHRRDMKSGWAVDIPSFAFVSEEKFPTFPIANNYLNGHDFDIIEVIGNIHETPHLLPQKHFR